MRNQSFPRWMAPMLGAGLGIAFGAQASMELQQLSWHGIAGGGALGLIGGLLLFLFDAPKKATPVVLRPSTTVGKSFAIFSVLTGIIPILGLIFALIALRINRGVAGWPRLTAIVGVILASVVSSAFTVLIGIAVWVSRN